VVMCRRILIKSVWSALFHYTSRHVTILMSNTGKLNKLVKITPKLFLT